MKTKRSRRYYQSLIFLLPLVATCFANETPKPVPGKTNKGETATELRESPSPQPVGPGVAEEIAKIKKQWPVDDPASDDFYRHFRLAKTHYQKTMPSLFNNDVWPRLVALHAEESLAKEKPKKEASPSKARTSASRSTKRNSRSPRHLHAYEYKMGATYKVVNGKWKPVTKPKPFGGGLGGTHYWINDGWARVETETGLKKVPLKKNGSLKTKR